MIIKLTAEKTPITKPSLRFTNAKICCLLDQTRGAKVTKKVKICHIVGGGWHAHSFSAGYIGYFLLPSNLFVLAKQAWFRFWHCFYLELERCAVGLFYVSSLYFRSASSIPSKD